MPPVVVPPAIATCPSVQDWSRSMPLARNDSNVNVTVPPRALALVPSTSTVALSVTLPPSVVVVGAATRVVSVGATVAGVAQAVTSFVASTDPRPLAQSYPVPATYP